MDAIKEKVTLGLFNDLSANIVRKSSPLQLENSILGNREGEEITIFSRC
jgi:hypothetical protein